MIKIVSVEEMVAIEAATDAAGVSYDEMMERAGRAVAEVVLDVLGDELEERRVMVLVGPGNNGGDGLVAARLLAGETPLQVSCYLLRPRDESDRQLAAAREAGVFIVNAPDDQRWRVLRKLVASADVLIDGLLGTGTRLPIEGNLKKLLVQTSRALSRRRPPSGVLRKPAVPRPAGGPGTTVVAVDCPTGLDCDSGRLDPAAIPADVTVTFAAAKRGQLRFPGAGAVGSLVVADIGVPERLPQWEQVWLELADAAEVRAVLPARPIDSHKGTFGRVLVVAGSLNYIGAAYLAGLAAYRVGAGLVSMAVPRPIHLALAALLPEATWLPLPHEEGALSGEAVGPCREEASRAGALLVGPGLGRKPGTADLLRGLLQAGQDRLPPLVVDADGLNLLSEMEEEEWWRLLPSGAVLTPHPGEMARLTGMSRQAIQDDRVGVAREYAARWDCVVVLKGAYTAVATPDGRVVIQPFASAALAKAGTGDVLAGAIAGLLAQGVAPARAALAGAYLHGLAGRLAVQAVRSPRSLLASDVAAALGAALQQVE